MGLGVGYGGSKVLKEELLELKKLVNSGGVKPLEKAYLIDPKSHARPLLIRRYKKLHATCANYYKLMVHLPLISDSVKGKL
jgi:hypothetical protein